MTQPTLKVKYTQEIVPLLQKKLGYKSRMQVPRLTAIHINQGVAEGKNNPKAIEASVRELTQITGQKAVPTQAKKAISNFKLREGMKIGARVTLRRKKMYEFLDRLVNLALPGSRDFGGIKEKAFDGRGNYTLGIKEQIIFPEITIDTTGKIRGFNVTFVTNTDKDHESYQLLHALGLPFKNMHENN